MTVRTALGATVAGIVAAVVGVTGPTAAQAGTPSAAPEVRLTGTLLTTVVEPRPGELPRVATHGPAQAALRVKGRLVPVETDAVAHIAPGSTVTLDVAVPDAVDTEAADSPAELAAATTAEATSAGTAPLEVTEVVATTEPTEVDPTARALTIVNVTPKGATASPASEEAITAQVAAADRFWRDNSRETIGLRVATIAPRYRSAHTCDDPFAMWDEAVQRTGWTEAANSSLVLVLPAFLPEQHGCAYGQATLGDGLGAPGYAWVQGTSPDVLAHEIGHNMSLEHSNLLTCRTKTQDVAITRGWWPTGCTEWEYGDRQDIMSADLFDDSTTPMTNLPSPMLSSPQALSLGLLERGAATSVPVGRTTRVTLRPLAGRTGVRAVSVLNDRTRVRYWVEYRTRAGRDRYNTQEQSTGVRVLRRGPDGTTVLLDPTPSGTFDHTQALTPGRSVRTYDGHLVVRTVSTTSTEAVVDITSVRGDAFVTLTRPTITGTRAVGQRLAARPGTWNPTPTSYSYRWYRGSTAISGATRATYTPTRSDAGRHLHVRVTASRSGFTTKHAKSASTGIPMYLATRPTLTGTRRVGHTLAITHGAWTPTATSYRYTWYRNGTVITGATGKRYRLTSRDAGKRVHARVQARRTGYVSGARTTAAGLIAR